MPDANVADREPPEARVATRHVHGIPRRGTCASPVLDSCPVKSSNTFLDGHESWRSRGSGASGGADRTGSGPPVPVPSSSSASSASMVHVPTFARPRKRICLHDDAGVLLTRRQPWCPTRPQTPEE